MILLLSLIVRRQGIDAEEDQEVDSDDDKAVMVVPTAPMLGNINALLGIAQPTPSASQQAIERIQSVYFVIFLSTYKKKKKTPEEIDCRRNHACRRGSYSYSGSSGTKSGQIRARD